MKIIRPMTVNDAALVSSNVAETDHTAWSSGTTYALGDRVRVVSTDIHTVYESLQAGNLNHTPASSATWWALVGSTNRWKMFDAKVSSQTSNTSSIHVVLQSSGRTDALALMNIAAASVTVVATDAVEGVVYNETVSLVSTDGIDDWYPYFFEEVERKTDLVLTDLPAYLNLELDVTLTDTGATVLCGVLAAGQQATLGSALHGSSVGLVDYSKKTQNAYGDYEILQRAYSRRATFNLMIPRSRIDRVQTLLAAYRATPVVWIGDPASSSTVLYGFYKDFNLVISYPDYTDCSLEIEGLT